jgi:hypothetical protein
VSFFQMNGPPPMTQPTPALTDLRVNARRFLSVEAAQNASRGHPGLPQFVTSTCAMVDGGQTRRVVISA